MADLDDLRKTLDAAAADRATIASCNVNLTPPSFDWQNVPDLSERGLYRDNTEAMGAFYEERLGHYMAALQRPGAQQDVSWAQVDAPAMPAAIQNYFGSCDLLWFEDSFYAVSTRVPAVARVTEDGWEELVAWNDVMQTPGLIDGGRALVRGDQLVIVGNNGAVYALRDGTWTTEAAPSDALKRRHGFDVLALVDGTLLVHGGFQGYSGGRPAPSLHYADGAWTKLSGKKSSKMSDLRTQTELSSRTGERLAFGVDTFADSIGPVRICRTVAGRFDGKWVDGEVPGLAETVNGSHRQFVYDSETGVTLAVSHDGRIARFALDGCELVGSTGRLDSGAKPAVWDPHNKRLVRFTAGGPHIDVLELRQFL